MCSSDPPPPASGPNTRCGYVTLLGRPNAGKSTLMNALVGDQLSIVTSKAQTTWQRVTGIVTTEDAQLVFLDTPGLLEPRDLLQRTMLSQALEALSEADVTLLVLDSTNPPDGPGRDLVLRTLSEGPGAPLVCAINKTDTASVAQIDDLNRWVREDLEGEAFATSALKGSGLEALLARVSELLPLGPFLYPEDEIARDPVRFFVGEFVRECIFEAYYQEIPYSSFCQIEEFRENQDPIYIQATVYVERKSQKRILIGKGGSSIRSLGALSREKMEAFLGRGVYLDLWIKVLPDWRRKRGHLKRLGFSVPDEVVNHGAD